MKKNIFIFLAILFFIIFEISFLSNFFSQRRVPSLVLIFVIILSIQADSKNSWKWAILAGMLFDIMTAQLPGLHSFAFLAVNVPAGFISRRLITSNNAWNILIIVALFFFGTLLSDWLEIMLVKLEFLFGEKKYLEGLAIFDGEIFYRALYGAILGALSYNLIKKMLEYFSKRQPVLR